MTPMEVLVIGAGSRTGTVLTERLDPVRFRVSTVPPGPGLLTAMRERRPEVAVLDAVDARPGAAPLEVALLKDHSPGVRIIALSDEPSPRDAEVVEQGIACYLGGCSLEELLRVIESIARERAGDGNALGGPEPRSVP